MSADKKTADLEAELAAARKRIAELEAARGGGVDPQRAAKIARIKAAAKKVTEHDGTVVALYRVGAAGHYREGRLYGHGEVVRIPVDQDPSETFEPVVEDAKTSTSAQPTPPADSKPKRASDREV